MFPRSICLERVIGQVAVIIRDLRLDQAALPTPCADWTVHDLVTHVIGKSMPTFAAVARGETADWRAPAAEMPEDWSGAFDAAASELLAAWHAADLDQLVPGGGGQAPLRGHADQQITELAVHGWDLATATGQDITLDPDVAEHALAWSRSMLRPEHRGAGQGFGAAVRVPPGAPVYDRLAGWFGRDPAWKPRA